MNTDTAAALAADTAVIVKPRTASGVRTGGRAVVVSIADDGWLVTVRFANGTEVVRPVTDVKIAA